MNAIMSYDVIRDIKHVIFRCIFDDFMAPKQIYVVVNGKWFQILSIFGSILNCNPSFKIRSHNSKKSLLCDLTQFMLSYLKHIPHNGTYSLTINSITIVIDNSGLHWIYSHIMLIFDSDDCELIYFPVAINRYGMINSNITFTNINVRDISLTLSFMKTTKTYDTINVNKIHSLLKHDNAVLSWSLVGNELIY